MIGSSTSEILGDADASEDRISDMPKDVLHMILEALPLRDAVRTSVLSRKWQYHWLTTSQLVFTYKFFESLSIEFLTDLHVKNIIDKILELRTGPIRKFTLEIDPPLSLTDDLDRWLHLLSTKGIKEFTLLFTGHDTYKLGTELYSCLELTYLNILKCDLNLNPPTAFEGFPNLTTLELFMVSVNEKFADVVSACPQLERVSILSCKGIHNLIVRAPNLKYLRVQQVNGLKTVCLNSTKKLETFFISFCNSIPLARMEMLCLGDNICKFSVASSIPKRLPTSLDNLKMIVLSNVDFNDAAQMACTLCLIQSSPKMSQLEIWGQMPRSAVRPYHNFVEDYGDHDCSFGQLQNVKFIMLQGDLEAEMALIEFLLLRSPVLEHMSIKMASEIGDDESRSMCKTLMRFGRVSRNAAIYLQVGSFSAGYKTENCFCLTETTIFNSCQIDQSVCPAAE